MTQEPAGTNLLDPAKDWPLGTPSTQDAREALGEALARYLFGVTFRRFGGTEADGVFRLKKVRQEWPEPDEVLEYPAASVIDYGDGIAQPHNFVPTPIEETWHEFAPCTVLVKTGELVAKFQVDFWTDDLPTRQAIAAQLPRLFAPGMTTSRLLLRTGPRYYGRPGRFTLLSWQRPDDAGNVYVRERRIMALVQAEIDLVDLRHAQDLIPSVQLDETSGPEATIATNDPGECCASLADQETPP